MNYSNSTHQIINNIIMMARPTYKYIGELKEMADSCKENNWKRLPFYKAFSIWIKDDKELFKAEVRFSRKRVMNQLRL